PAAGSSNGSSTRSSRPPGGSDRVTGAGAGGMKEPPLVLSFFGRRRVPAGLQSAAAECGLACLAMVAGYHGLKTDLTSLTRRWSLSQKGSTLAPLNGMARDLYLSPRWLRL